MHERGPIHVVDRLAPGGIETLVLDMLGAGSEQRVFSLQGETKALVEHWRALDRYSDRIDAFSKGMGIEPSLVLRLTRRLRALAPRAVILHHVGPLLYGGIAARLANIGRIIHVEHDVWHYSESPRHRTLLTITERLIRPRHIAVSSKAGDVIRAIVPGARIAVVPPGIDTDRFRPRDKQAARARLGLSETRRLIGTAGRLATVKQQSLMLEALVKIAPDVDAAIAGSGPELEPLTELAKNLGLSGRVHFLGQRADLEEVLPAFDVFCLPSKAEGLPRSVLEAQACGVPVVATDVGALDEAVSRETGRLVPIGDAAALADALTVILEAAPSVEKSRQHVLDSYSLEGTLRSYERVISE
ncbi:MAG: hypothetical protein RLZ98_3368 [Pseudomonadota bacterium]|jgi:glycosyltransferase involved in cell wall biosynthesis